MTRIVVGGTTHQLLLRSLAPMIRAIGPSLGPEGRAALFDMGGRVGRAASGVAIAREASSGEGLAGVAQKILREAMIEADRELGDGSARLALMAEASFRAAAMQAAVGVCPTRMAEGLSSMRGRIAELIAGYSQETDDLAAVALAAGVSPRHAEALADTFGKVGMSGTVEVTAANESGLAVDHFSGFVFDASVVGSALPAGAAWALDDVHVIAADDVISDFGTLLPVIEGFAAKRKSLVIAAREVSGAALAAIERNRKAGILSIAVLKPSDGGPRAAAIIEDLALATGAALVAERNGLTLSGLKPSMLGQASSVRFHAGRAAFQNPRGSHVDVEARVRAIEDEVRKNRHLSLDREHAERRRARLLGRWADIRIGGANDHETEAMVGAARSAIACMRSAALSGVVPGGGETLSHVADQMKRCGNDAASTAAAKAAAEGLRSIGRQLELNAGRPSDWHAERPSPLGQGGRKAVFDPLRLTQILVDRALSIAGLLLRVDAVVVR